MNFIYLLTCTIFCAFGMNQLSFPSYLEYHSLRNGISPLTLARICPLAASEEMLNKLCIADHICIKSSTHEYYCAQCDKIIKTVIKSRKETK